MLGLISVRKLVCRLPRGDCSDQHCGPERALCVGLLRMFEYYAYFISHGQESACGGRVRPHGLAVSAFKQSCPIYSRNEPTYYGGLFSQCGPREHRAVARFALAELPCSSQLLTKSIDIFFCFRTIPESYVTSCQHVHQKFPPKWGLVITKKSPKNGVW